MLEQLQAEVSRLRSLVEASPLWHRKDLERMLGLSSSTLTRRMKRRDFPKPAIYDAGRPKWRPADFPGQLLSR
jgi:predicted DNA-binding transcriptional regulator AlpA